MAGAVCRSWVLCLSFGVFFNVSVFWIYVRYTAETKLEILCHIVPKWLVKSWTFTDVHKTTPVTRQRCSRWTAFLGNVYAKRKSSGSQCMWGVKSLEMGHSGFSSSFAEKERTTFLLLKRQVQLPPALSGFLQAAKGTCGGDRANADEWTPNPSLFLMRGNRDVGWMHMKPELQHQRGSMRLFSSTQVAASVSPVWVLSTAEALRSNCYSPGRRKVPLFPHLPLFLQAAFFGCRLEIFVNPEFCPAK